MLNAILQKGVIVPIEPLPPNWTEGLHLEVNAVEEPPFDIDEWAETMNRLCADSSPEDEEAMRQAIDEHRKQAKEQVRREMGLAP